MYYSVFVFFFITQAMRFPPKSYSKDLESLEVCATTINCKIYIFEKFFHHNALCKQIQHCWSMLGVVAFLLDKAKSLTGFKLCAITPNNLQQHATGCANRRNMQHPAM